jgi:Cytochrome P450
MDRPGLTSMCVSLVTGSRWIKRVNDMVTSLEIFFTIEIRRLGNQSLGRCWLRPTVSRLDLLCASGLGPADILIVMMNAGSDTTAIAMTNFLYIMMKHPHILAKLRVEIDGALKDEEPNMKVAPYAKVRNLPYLKACIGRNISYLEQMIFFATILRRYEFAFKQPDWELKRVEGLNTWPQQFPL